MQLTEAQLQLKVAEIYKEEQFKILQEKWNTLAGYEKRFIFEFVKEFTPDKSYMLSEAKWYNTLGDILGIFDPTGVVDVINGISYFKQGDNMFGILSIISAIPIAGDIVGKSLMGIVKGGGTLAKEIKAIKTPADAAKIAEHSKIFKKLLGMIESISGRILSIIEKVPGGKRFTNVVRKWITLLQDANKIGKGAKLAEKGGKLSLSEFKVFRNYGVQDLKGFKKFWKKGGFFGKNRQLSRLLSKTKFWLGFLDLIGVANFVGPDELVAQMGESTVNAKMDEYMNTPEAEKNWNSEMSGLQSMETQQTPPPPPAPSTKTTDPFMNLFTTLLGGGLK